MKQSKNHAREELRGILHPKLNSKIIASTHAQYLNLISFLGLIFGLLQVPLYVYLKFFFMQNSVTLCNNSKCGIISFFLISSQMMIIFHHYRSIRFEFMGRKFNLVYFEWMKHVCEKQWEIYSFDSFLSLFRSLARSLFPEIRWTKKTTCYT